MEQPTITGYRQLNEAEAALINEIKAHGIALDELLRKVSAHVNSQFEAAAVDRQQSAALPFRWIAIARTDLQTGLMALTRAVAQPTTF